jgi:hypothetical protein
MDVSLCNGTVQPHRTTKNVYTHSIFQVHACLLTYKTVCALFVILWDKSAILSWLDTWQHVDPSHTGSALLRCHD